MSKIDTTYGAAAYYAQSTAKPAKKDAADASSRAASSENITNSTSNSGTSKLSEKAQALLKKLQSTYSDMDFMVADFDDESAKDILSRGTKEFSVLFSTDELEKMAADPDYEKECLDKIQGAIKMSKQINEQFGFESAFGQDSEKGYLTRIGISIDSCGITTYFAELEKNSAKQKERIEESQTEKKQEQKDKIKKENENSSARITVHAGSIEELIETINQIDWEQVKPETVSASGSKIDYAV